MNAEPSFGIIGCGLISRFHMQGLKKTGARVVRVSDLDEKNAAAFVEHFGAKYSADYADVLSDPAVTAVLVLTGSFLHKRICMQALSAGKDVVCEKTMTIDASDSRELARAAEASGKIFITAYMKRFFPAVAAAKELIPKLGTIISGSVRAYHNWGNFHDEQNISAAKINELKTIKERNGSIVLMCSGSHMIDMMLNLLGRPKSVYADIDFIGETELDRRATGLFAYQNGASVHFEAAASPHKKVGIHKNGWDEHIKLIGTGGRLELYTVEWDNPLKYSMKLLYYDESKGAQTERRFEPANPFVLEVEAYRRALGERKQINPDAADGFYVDAAIGAMFESSRKKKPVEIDWKGL